MNVSEGDFDGTQNHDNNFDRTHFLADITITQALIHPSLGSDTAYFDDNFFSSLPPYIDPISSSEQPIPGCKPPLVFTSAPTPVPPPQHDPRDLEIQYRFDKMMYEVHDQLDMS